MGMAGTGEIKSSATTPCDALRWCTELIACARCRPPFTAYSSVPGASAAEAELGEQLSFASSASTADEEDEQTNEEDGVAGINNSVTLRHIEAHSPPRRGSRHGGGMLRR